MSQIVMPTPHRPSMRPTATRRNSFTDDEDAITPCSSPPPEPNQPAFAASSSSSSSSSSSPSVFDEQETVSSTSSTTTNNNRRSVSQRFTPVSSRRGSASQQQHATCAASSRNISTSAAAASAWEHFDPTDGEPLSDAQLWKRMLAIQQEFHCYNSARMSAALLGLEQGLDVGQFAPSRKCLDLINESMSEMQPEEMQRLTEWVHENSSNSKRRRSHIWRRSFPSTMSS